jgi:4a-hydroxytetrahydrobiopterin dehydratase
MWTETDNYLTRTFVFNNFVEAFAFLLKVAMAAEKQNHHPTIINTYNKVELRLNTHDAGNTVTDKDRQLAADIDKLL